MFEDLLKEGLGSLMSQGAGWTLAVLCVIVIYFQDKRVDTIRGVMDKQREVANEAVKEQYEKRLSEFGEILEALGRNTTALGSMQDSVDARTDAINSLVTGFAKLARDLEINRERWDDKGQGIMENLKEMKSRIEAIQHLRVS